ncbi:prohormone-3 [Drosophila tropicalis]|uniref:prohormone-3 n=1 Tax=Drosophila tropicalis TaxID=46794 RepID=UPI0035AB720F
MRSIPMWAAIWLLFGLVLQLKDASATSAYSSFSSLPLAWQQQQQRNQFGRNSRNFLRRSGPSSSSLADAAAGGGGGDAVNLMANGYNEYSQLFDDRHARQQQKQQQQLRQQQQQTEVYGIVEPLIEDTPCADRACLVNDDCCPTGVCVNTYGEGKCVYVFGRKRDDDQCQRHSDCPTGSLCTLSNQEEAGGSAIWHCEASLMQELFGIKQKHSLGSECTSSSDCQLNIGMCCQQQRLHHRAMTKLSCGYFRDAFDCIDMAEHRNI